MDDPWLDNSVVPVILEKCDLENTPLLADEVSLSRQ
jgi:hypothetical protein